MTKEDIQLLYQYDRWANHRILKAVSALSPEQFSKDLGGGFRSVQDTFAHILGGEWIWLTYWRDLPNRPDALSKLVAQRDELFRPDQLPDPDAMLARWAEIEENQIQFVNALTDEDLQQAIPFRQAQVKLVHLMQHMANHSTYHRGQISMMLRQLGKESAATDFHVFLIEEFSGDPGV